MKSTYTAITQQDGDWWVGWIEEIPGVNAQEKTKDGLMTSLREILMEALEFNREEARASANGSYDGSGSRDQLAAEMTPADISEAQRRARVYLESQYKDCDS